MTEEFKMSNCKEWLNKQAKKEDYGCVSVGGLLAKHLDKKEKRGKKNDNS